MDTFRPKTLDDIVGQEALKKRLRITIDAAIERQKMPEHIFLAGPPGVGKTSLGFVVAEELGLDVECLTMPIKPESFIRLMRDFEGVVILDELHRCSERQQEEFLPLLEFGYMRTNRGTKIPLPDVMFIGTTTERQKVIEPLRERFGTKPFIVAYSDEEMGQIVQNMATMAGLEMSEEDALAYGQATGGIPRNARQFVIAIQDLQAAEGTDPTVKRVLDFCQTAPDGLTMDHLEYLRTLDRLGGLVGLSTLSASLRMSPEAIRETERLLEQRGLISYTDRGRELGKKGMQRARWAA